MYVGVGLGVRVVEARAVCSAGQSPPSSAGLTGKQNGSVEEESEEAITFP